MNDGTTATLASGVINGSVAGAGRRVEGEEDAAAKPPGPFSPATVASGVTDGTVVVNNFASSNHFAPGASSGAPMLRNPVAAQLFGDFAHGSVRTSHSTQTKRLYSLLLYKTRGVLDVFSLEDINHTVIQHVWTSQSPVASKVQCCRFYLYCTVA